MFIRQKIQNFIFKKSFSSDNNSISLSQRLKEDYYYILKKVKFY
jgi:hypothetical protein